MSLEFMQEIIENVKNSLEKDERIKACHKFQTNKSLQIQLHNGENFNLVMIKLDENAFIIKRRALNIKALRDEE